MQIVRHQICTIMISSNLGFVDKYTYFFSEPRLWGAGPKYYLQSRSRLARYSSHKTHFGFRSVKQFSLDELLPTYMARIQNPR